MSESDDDAPVESIFSKRAEFIPKKSPEEMKAAAELLEKHMSAAEAEPMCKKGRKQKFPSDPAGTESDLMSDLSNVKLSPAAKKRLKKLRDAQKKDLELVDALNAEILSSETNSDIPIIPEPENSEVPESLSMKLTVVYLNKYGRFECVKDENFVEVLKKIGHFFGIKPSEFKLCLKDRNIAFCDTPRSLSLSPTDILEVIPYKVYENTDFDDPNYLLISFQSNLTNVKFDMVVNKIEKFQTIMERYAEQLNLPLKYLQFECDGVKLFGFETPAELDLVDLCVIDVRVSTAIPQLFGFETPAELDLDDQSVIDVRVSTAIPQCSKSGSDSPVAGCSYASNYSPVAGCSYANDDNNDSPVAGCSNANNNNDGSVADSSNGKAEPTSSYLKDYFIGETDSNDSDVIILD